MMSKSNVADKKKDMSAAEELIRDVSESVIQRNLPGRRRRRGARAQTLPTGGAGAAPDGISDTSGGAVSSDFPLEPTAPQAGESTPPALAADQPAAARAEPPVLLQPPPSAVLLSLSQSTRKIAALICHEDAESPIGRMAAGYADGLALRGHVVHIFARSALPAAQAGVRMHVLGGSRQENLLERVHEFTQRVQSAFHQHLDGGAATLLGFEWASIPSLLELASERKLPALLSLNSLECQRSDMSSDMSKHIEEIELSGLRHATRLLLHEQSTAREAQRLAPECHEHLTAIACPFPAAEFKGIEDAGAIKARIHVGPIDPLVLFIGNLDERHGPDILMKSVVPVLKNHPQTRFAFVGDGTLQWPLRVHARYLLLEHAVRMLGHIGGEALFELIQAADIICVPSREQTELWPLQAAWAARRPVVATHDMAGGLIQHEQNGVLIYPSESSCVWGIERLLFSEELRQQLAENGRRTLDEKFGWDNTAAQLEDLMALNSAAAN